MFNLIAMETVWVKPLLNYNLFSCIALPVLGLLFYFCLLIGNLVYKNLHWYLDYKILCNIDENRNKSEGNVKSNKSESVNHAKIRFFTFCWDKT